MPSDREMRRRIDEMVDLPGKALTVPADTQQEAIEALLDAGREHGFNDLVESMSRILALPPADRTKVIRMMRGDLLTIKRDQFGG